MTANVFYYAIKKDNNILGVFMYTYYVAWIICKYLVIHTGNKCRYLVPWRQIRTYAVLVLSFYCSVQIWTFSFGTYRMSVSQTLDSMQISCSAVILCGLELLKMVY